MTDVPVFAVVGHPNQGKSSVVSTLTQDDHIVVSAVSGTTRSANRFCLMLDGSAVYELVDTPGFQRPRQVLEWCAARCDSAAERPRVLAEFLREHRDDERFHDDCALLAPVLEGAGIVYVVDPSQALDASFEAELTLLSWTAQPRLAILNPMQERSAHEPAWRAALQQYFSLVRSFNPLLAPFEQHLGLLTGMAEIHSPWRAPLLRGVEALRQQRDARHREAADRLVDYLQSVLRFQLQMPMTGPRESVQKQGHAEFNRELQRREKTLQKQLADVYGHSRIDWDSEWRELAAADLTDVREWRVWGLPRARLASLSAGAGAMSGLALDAATGGASLFTGALVGGAIGGLAGAWAGRDPLTFELISKTPGYEHWQLGPVSNLSFATALTGRALRSWYQLRLRNHAQRDALLLNPQDLEHWLNGLGQKQQRQLLFWLQKIMKRPLNEAEQNQLQLVLVALGEQMEAGPEQWGN